MSNFCPVGFKLLSASKFGCRAARQVISLLIKWRRLNLMNKKNWLLLIIMLTAALLMAIVYLIYAKRIKHIENKMNHSNLSAQCVSAIPRAITV